MKLLILLLFFCISSCTDDNIIVNKEALIGKKGNLFIITKNWGLTSDNQLTIISTNDETGNDLNFDSTTTYVYKGLDPFVYKFENDSLFVYSDSGYIAPKPTKFSSLIIVKQVYLEHFKYYEYRGYTSGGKSEYKLPGQTMDKPKYEVPPPPPFKK